MSRRAFLLWLPLSDAIVAGLKRSVSSTTFNSTDLPCCTNALRWINKVLRESMNKRFFLRTVYSLFFPAGGGQKRCPTMWPKWMWPKSSAFIFGIRPKWEDGRHTRFIFTPLLWQLRRTYNCPGNTQTEDGQGLEMSHQDSKVDEENIWIFISSLWYVLHGLHDIQWPVMASLDFAHSRNWRVIVGLG